MRFFRLALVAALVLAPGRLLLAQARGKGVP